MIYGRVASIFLSFILHIFYTPATDLNGESHYRLKDDDYYHYYYYYYSDSGGCGGGGGGGGGDLDSLLFTFNFQLTTK